ncbi:MAG TPA: hypothetical protein VGH98_16630 [Gemmatimonadaceae bacterium]|jgi:hypothetical protein
MPRRQQLLAAPVRTITLPPDEQARSTVRQYGQFLDELRGSRDAKVQKSLDGVNAECLIRLSEIEARARQIPDIDERNRFQRAALKKERRDYANELLGCGQGPKSDPSLGWECRTNEHGTPERDGEPIAPGVSGFYALCPGDDALTLDLRNAEGRLVLRVHTTGDRTLQAEALHWLITLRDRYGMQEVRP